MRHSRSSDGEPSISLPKKERLIVRGLKYYNSGASESVTDPATGRVYNYRRQYRARLIVEAAMNEMTYADYVRVIKSDPRGLSLATLPDGVDVHHKDENTLNDVPENLEVLSKADHTLTHDPLSHFGVEYTKLARIVSVASAGDVMTYDVQMRSPCSNFATDGGLIVHNSAKSAVAKAAGNEGGVPTIQLDLGAAKGSLVGQSEQQLRTALKVVSSVSNGQSLWIATCNSIGTLPPELRRRFNLGVFFFELPSAEERALIWDIWVAKFGLDAETVGERPDDTGWTGAEIKQACDIAWRLGCTLVEAAEFVVPVSRSAGDQIQKLREQASGRFLSASHRGVYKYDAGAMTSAPAANGKKTRQKLQLAD